MKKIRQKSRILGAVVLTLLCLAVVASPASASIEQLGPESVTETNESFGRQIASWGDALLNFLRDLGGIFAEQSGTTITD